MLYQACEKFIDSDVFIHYLGGLTKVALFKITEDENLSPNIPG